MNNSLLEEIQAAYDAHNIEPIRCIYFHVGLGYACPLAALAIHRGIVNKSDPNLELDGDDNPALAWACDEFGDDWAEGFLNGFDGDERSRSEPSYLAGYDFGELTLENLFPGEFPFCNDAKDEAVSHEQHPS